MNEIPYPPVLTEMTMRSCAVLRISDIYHKGQEPYPSGAFLLI